MKELLSRFEAKAPQIVFEWHDAETPAKGWVVINSLRGGALASKRLSSSFMGFLGCVGSRCFASSAQAASRSLSSSSVSPRVFSNMCSRSSTLMPRRSGPDTSRITRPWCSITVRLP